MDQYVQSYNHTFTVADDENSHWPEGETNFTLFGVTTWKLKPGSFGQMNAAKAKISSLAKEHGWPRYWAWNSPVAGDSDLSLVSPFNNYAEMAPPEQGFLAFLTEHMESAEAAQELLGSFSTSFSDSSYTVYLLREDLSTPADE